MNSNIIGIDLGGTNISVGLVIKKELQKIFSRKINAHGSVEEVLQELFSATDQLINNSVTAIGIGIPGLVDHERGLVFDVINIPSWKEIPLQKWMEEQYHLPVQINNDANCFVLGEFYFGKGRGCHSMIGLTIGTGLGSGLILNKKLYNGKNCGAGEFGMIDYLDKYYEYYASGQYFKNVYQTDWEVVFKNARKGNAEAIRMYEEMGKHLGNAIKMMLYALDVELIVLGGSVRHAYPYFAKIMWQQIKTSAFKKSAEGIRIEISELKNSGVLGAAALFYEHDWQLSQVYKEIETTYSYSLYRFGKKIWETDCFWLTKCDNINQNPWDMVLGYFRTNANQVILIDNSDAITEYAAMFMGSLISGTILYNRTADEFNRLGRVFWKTPFHKILSQLQLL